MHSLFSILPLLATALLTSASPAPRTYQTLSLPVDFDLSHPALDYAAHAAALAANPNAVIPQLPADILALAQTVKVDDITADADTVICETSGRSPTRADGLDVGNSLERNGPSLCCHTGGQYTVMWYGGTAKVDIGGNLGKCISCDYAGSSIRDIANDCYRNINGRQLAGGYKRIGPGTLNLVVRLYHN